MYRSKNGRSVWRVLAVIAITVIAFFNSTSDVALTWHPLSTFGMSMDISQTIVGIDPGGPADRAGLKVGDAVDSGATPVAS